jgi:hypothetical protein
MNRTNRMIRYALAAGVACAALAGAAAAVPDQDAATSKDPAMQTQPLGQSASSTSGPKDAQSAIASWPVNTKKAAQAMIEKYGQPDGVTDRTLVWYDKEPWQKVAVFREPVKHATPMPHEDFLENTINYKVPENKVADLIRFDQALVIDVTRGTLSSHCDSEGANFLALNLANEIVTGKRDVASAKDFQKGTLTKSMAGKSSPYMDKLMFSASSSSSMKEGTPAEEQSESPAQEREEPKEITPGTPQQAPQAPTMPGY